MAGFRSTRQRNGRVGQSTLHLGASVGDRNLARSLLGKCAMWLEVQADGSVRDMHDTNRGVCTTSGTGVTTVLCTSQPYALDVGTSDYLSVAHQAAFNLNRDMAMIVWAMRSGAQGNFPKFMQKATVAASGQATYQLAQDNFSNGGKVGFRVTTGGSNTTVYSASAMADATVYRIAGVRQATNISIWMNDTEARLNTIATYDVAMDTGSNDVRYGYNGFSGDHLIGKIGSSMLFTSDLTSAELAYERNSGAGRNYAQVLADAGL